MTTYEKVKAALDKGIPPEQVAAFFGVSVDLVKKVKQLMEETKSLTN